VALILEVLDARTGEVRARRRLDGPPLSVGRGLDNDIVLDDPYADVCHARIGADETGALVIEDLGSVNALVHPDGTRRTRLAAAPGTVVRVGRTTLRFRDSDAPLPPALPDRLLPSQPSRLPRWLATWWGQLIVAAVATGAFAWDTWLGTYAKSGASEAVSTGLGVLLLVALWAGVWAVAGRVVVHRFRFLAHLALASAVGVVALAYATLGEWGAFLFPGSSLGDAISGLFAILLVATLVAGHLGLASALPRRHRWVAGFVTCGVLVAIGGIVTLAEEKSFSDVAEFSATLKPLPTALLPAGTLDGFTAVEANLQRQVDQLATRKE
jgi:pSer/pThr/pTyr-binding forkhead associated (FHA) protein